MDPVDIRAEALAILDAQDAHMTFDDAVADFPASAMNVRPPNVGYTPWQLLEHLRITQWDILEYIRTPSHTSPDWPVGYWPTLESVATRDRFDATVAAFRADQAALRALVADPWTDLLAVLPNTPGHTILREIRVVADHNAYHIGEFAILRQVMGTWPADRPD
jgi:hypothetical protein